MIGSHRQVWTLARQMVNDLDGYVYLIEMCEACGATVIATQDPPRKEIGTGILPGKEPTSITLSPQVLEAAKYGSQRESSTLLYYRDSGKMRSVFLVQGTPICSTDRGCIYSGEQTSSSSSMETNKESKPHKD